MYLCPVKANKMAGRPKIYDEDAVLDKAVKVFWEKGYANASADDLLTAMGIGKGSFYLAFKGGKQELFEKTMKRVVDQYFKELKAAVAASANPVKLVRDFFLGLASPQSSIGKSGCYFGNALVQITDTDTGLKTLAAGYLQVLENIFLDAMQRGKKMGLLKTDLAPKVLAAYLLNLWNGINITKRVEPNAKKLLELIKLNLEIIQ